MTDKMPNNTHEIADDKLAGVLGGKRTYCEEVEYTSHYNHARKDGTISATTFEEYVEEIGLTAEKQEWLKRTGGGK